MRQCQRVKTSVCTCAMSKQRHSVHSAFRESVMKTERQLPFSWSTSMFYLSGVAKQAVCLTQQQLQQQQKSQHAFSLAPDERGTFVLEIMWWKMSVLWFISLNKLQIAKWQLLWHNLHVRPKEETRRKARYAFILNCRSKLCAHEVIQFFYAYLDLMRIKALISIINPITQFINFFFDSQENR